MNKHSRDFDLRVFENARIRQEDDGVAFSEGDRVVPLQVDRTKREPETYVDESVWVLTGRFGKNKNEWRAEMEKSAGDLIAEGSYVKALLSKIGLRREIVTDTFLEQHMVRAKYITDEVVIQTGGNL